MKKDDIDSIISLYRKYNREKIQLAIDDTDNLNAYIHLTDSSINFSKETKEIIFSFNSDILKSIYDNMDNDNIVDSDILYSDKQLYQLFKFLELYYHESIHLVQKHVYGSIYDYTEAVQGIEDFEIFIIRAMLNDNYTFNIYEDFIESAYKYLKKDDDALSILFRSIQRNCNVALEVTKKINNKLTIIHLIEAQALYISRLNLGIENFTKPKNSLYNLAWDEFASQGGVNPLVFVLIIDASLRYGGIKKNTYHPVEIFYFLINMSIKLEKIFDLITNEIEIFENSNYDEKFRSCLFPTSNHLTINDILNSEGSSNEIIDIIDKKVSLFIEEEILYNFDNAEINLKSLKTFNSYFEKNNYEFNSPKNICFLFSKQIAKILANRLNNVEKNISDVIDFYDDGVVHNIADLFKNHFHDYKYINIIIDIIFSRLDNHEKFPQTGDYYGAIVKFCEAMDDIFLEKHGEMEYPLYQTFIKIIEVIKGVLSICSNENTVNIGIYCCEKHSYIMYDDVEDIFKHLDSCMENDSISRLLCEIFEKESILDFFNFGQ